jgi:hypothetical protein
VKLSSSLSGEGVLVIRGDAISAVGVMNIEDTRLDVYRLDVSTGVMSGVGSRCGGEGACCGMIGMCRGNDGPCRDKEEDRRGTEEVRCTIVGASFGRVGALCGGYADAAAAGGFTSCDKADTTAFGRCFGEYRCVP